MLVVTQEGALQLWKQLLGIAQIDYPFVHLFAAAYTPLHTDTYATYAAIEVPANVGYAPQQLVKPAAGWTLSVLPSGAQAVYIPLTWSFTDETEVSGYWLSDYTNTYSLYAEQLAAPYTFPLGGGVFVLQLASWLASAPSVSGIPCTAP